MILEEVPLEYIHLVWPDVAPLLEGTYKDGLPTNKEFTLEQTRLLLSRGEWKLIISVRDNKPHGAIIVQVRNRFNDRVAFVLAAGGKGVINEHLIPQMWKLATQWGATALECAGQPALVRALKRYGATVKYTVLEVPNGD